MEGVDKSYVFERSNSLPVIRHSSCDGSCDIASVGGEEVYVCAIDKVGFNEVSGAVVGCAHDVWMPGLSYFIGRK